MSDEKLPCVSGYVGDGGRCNDCGSLECALASPPPQLPPELYAKVMAAGEKLLDDNATVVRHLEVLANLIPSIAVHNERIDAVCWLVRERSRLSAEVERLRAELDESKQVRKRLEQRIENQRLANRGMARRMPELAFWGVVRSLLGEGKGLQGGGKCPACPVYGGAILTLVNGVATVQCRNCEWKESERDD